MEPLTPIPTPAAQRWREFRIQALPVLTFIAVVACIAVLWQRYVFPSNIVAQVEVVAATVITTMPGTVEMVAVQRFQQVKKGDVIAIVSVAETNLAYAEVQAAQSEAQVLRARLEMDRFRASQVYEQERLTLLEQRVQLAVEKVTAQAAETKMRLQEELYTNSIMANGISSASPLTSSNAYALARIEFEASQVRIKQTEQFLNERERTLPRLMAENTNTTAILEADVIAQINRVSAATTNIVLRAPIDGVVSVVSNRPGERVMAGAPIAVVTGAKAERIIAYMRQPISSMPKPGDTLQVRRRTFKRQAATATVSDVGTQLEPISAVLLAGATTMDLGLPFAITIPANFEVVPGELIDVIYDRKE
jgi:multidrug resistance efflux pump